MYVARFKDSRRAIARRRTEDAAWRAAQMHDIDLAMIEVVTEQQHLADVREHEPMLPGEEP